MIIPATRGRNLTKLSRGRKNADWQCTDKRLMHCKPMWAVLSHQLCSMCSKCHDEAASRRHDCFPVSHLHASSRRDGTCANLMATDSRRSRAAFVAAIQLERIPAPASRFTCTTLRWWRCVAVFITHVLVPPGSSWCHLGPLYATWVVSVVKVTIIVGVRARLRALYGFLKPRFPNRCPDPEKSRDSVMLGSHIM